jgi:hypothetical protein
MKRHLYSFLASSILLTAPWSAFGGDSGARTIVQLGCHQGSDICYAYLDAVVGPPSCRSDSIRWQPSSTNGREIFTLLQGAFLAGKSVMFWVADNRCFAPQPAYPTFDFATVFK